MQPADLEKSRARITCANEKILYAAWGKKINATGINLGGCSEKNKTKSSFVRRARERVFLKMLMQHLLSRKSKTDVLLRQTIVFQGITRDESKKDSACSELKKIVKIKKMSESAAQRGRKLRTYVRTHARPVERTINYKNSNSVGSARAAIS